MRRCHSGSFWPVAWLSFAIVGSSVGALNVAKADAPGDAGAAIVSKRLVARPRTPFLLWRFEAVVRGPEHVFDMCTPTNVTWMDEHDRALWTRPVPARLREQQVCSPDYARHARDWVGSPVASGLGQPLVTKDAIAFADWGGVWVLRIRDGATIVNHAMEWRLRDHEPPRAIFFFDDGTFELGGTTSCTGDARGARIFARCGAQVLFFNGTRAALLDAATWKVVSATELTPAGIRTKEHARSEATLSLGGRTLTLRGQTYL